MRRAETFAAGAERLSLTLPLCEAKVPPPTPETNAVHGIEPNPLGYNSWRFPGIMAAAMHSETRPVLHGLARS
jgi:hypothetical protein